MLARFPFRATAQNPIQAVTFRPFHLWTLTTASHRRLHTKAPQQHLVSNISSIPDHAVQTLTAQLPKMASTPPPSSSTSHLSFWALLQTYLMTACTSSPLIIGPSIKILSTVASAKSIFLSPDRNPLLHALLKYTVYRQFCAGENAAEVQSTIARLQDTGINGVILCYAREVELRSSTDDVVSKHASEAAAQQDIESWSQGVLKTIRIVPEGNFISLKFSGAGRLALEHLKKNLPPPPLLAERIHEICTLAYSRRIRICIDAEQSIFQAGIDKWTLDLQREFNSLAKDSNPDSKAWACIYNTYQTYLRAAPATLNTHLLLAARENFILGVKLVRGAYLASEPRTLFWPNKEETDSCFDSLARCLITSTWNDTPSQFTSNNTTTITPPQPQPSSSSLFPQTSLVLATHNLISTRKALSLHREQTPSPSRRSEIFYAQLQGMADHVTGELIAAAQVAQEQQQHKASVSSDSDSESDIIIDSDRDIDVPQVFKYLTWGSVSECAAYLVRRAEENRDAVSRTVEARKALGREVGRRIWKGFGWGR